MTAFVYPLVHAAQRNHGQHDRELAGESASYLGPIPPARKASFARR